MTQFIALTLFVCLMSFSIQQSICPAKTLLLNAPNGCGNNRRDQWPVVGHNYLFQLDQFCWFVAIACHSLIQAHEQKIDQTDCGSLITLDMIEYEARESGNNYWPFCLYTSAIIRPPHAWFLFHTCFIHSWRDSIDTDRPINYHLMTVINYRHNHN